MHNKIISLVSRHPNSVRSNRKSVTAIDTFFIQNQNSTHYLEASCTSAAKTNSVCTYCATPATGNSIMTSSNNRSISLPPAPIKQSWGHIPNTRTLSMLGMAWIGDIMMLSPLLIKSKAGTNSRQ